MKNYYKEAKTIKGINGYLKTIGLEALGLDEAMINNGYTVDYFDFDGLFDSDTDGAYVCFYKNNDSYEVFAGRYTAKDIAKMEAEIA